VRQASEERYGDSIEAAQSRDGDEPLIDEVPEPENPWANIGYWSDHQIIYLLKLLEAMERFEPGRLSALLNRRAYSHVDVPYRIKPYPQLLDDPAASIEFDWGRERLIAARVATRGADGKLLHDARGRVIHLSLAEELLLLALAKLVNFVPEGGIWMNTQRPEWNDANNALVACGCMALGMYLLRSATCGLPVYARLIVPIDGYGLFVAPPRGRSYHQREGEPCVALPAPRGSRQSLRRARPLRRGEDHDPGRADHYRAPSGGRLANAQRARAAERAESGDA
jgi:hypothetical protein